jgi:hypothetical protein
MEGSGWGSPLTLAARESKIPTTMHAALRFGYAYLTPCRPTPRIG